MDPVTIRTQLTEATSPERTEANLATASLVLPHTVTGEQVADLHRNFVVLHNQLVASDCMDDTQLMNIVDHLGETGENWNKEVKAANRAYFEVLVGYAQSNSSEAGKAVKAGFNELLTGLRPAEGKSKMQKSRNAAYQKLALYNSAVMRSLPIYNPDSDSIEPPPADDPDSVESSSTDGGDDGTTQEVAKSSRFGFMKPTLTKGVLAAVLVLITGGVLTYLGVQGYLGQAFNAAKQGVQSAIGAIRSWV